MDNTITLLGLAKRAARLEVGEEPVGAASRAREARLIVVARDAAENTYRRVRHFADAGAAIWVSVPYTKEELGRAVGRTSCAMLAITDAGFAAAFAGKLAQADPEKFSQTAALLHERSEKIEKRAAEQRAHDRNRRRGNK